MNKIPIYLKLSRVQQKLMGMEISSVDLEDLLPLIFKECLEENLMFYFNFIENACVLNLRDLSDENLELNVRLYYPNDPGDISCKKLKEQVLLNAFLLTKKSNTVEIVSSASEETQDVKPIQESNIVPPRAIRAAMEVIEKRGETPTKNLIEKELQLDKMSTDNRRQCIAYLKDMKE